ncbi:MAG: hypothetical protein V4622_11505 [Bacteroidota bacterium]
MKTNFFRKIYVFVAVIFPTLIFSQDFLTDNFLNSGEFQFDNSKQINTLLSPVKLDSTDKFKSWGYTRFAGGYNFSKIMLKDNYTSDIWKGIHFRENFFEMGYSRGTITKNDTNSNGSQFYIGASFPIKSLSFGKRYCSVKGYKFAPFVAANVGILNLAGAKNYTGTFAPGFSLQLPYTLVDFRLNTIIPLTSRGNPGLSNVIFMPTVTFQLDGLWDAMDPELKIDGAMPSSYSYDAIVWGLGTDGGGNEVWGYWGLNPKSNNDGYYIYKYQVGAHISLGPRFTYFNFANDKTGNEGEVAMYGFVQSGRAENFGYDLIVESGKIGLSDKFQNESIKTTRAIGRLSVNLAFSHHNFTQFSRLMLGVGLGQNWFSKPKIEEEFANGQFANFSLSLEFGAIAVSYEFDKYFFGRFDDLQYLSFVYRLPIERLIKKYKATKNSRDDYK